MNKLLLASVLAVGLAGPALAQSTNAVSPSDAVNNASILPGGTGGASNVLPADPGQSSVLPRRDGTRSGSGTGIDTQTTRSVTPNVAVPNATTPNLNQPGTGLNEGIVPDSSGGIPGTQNKSGVPGSTSTGPAAGGSSAY